MTSRITLSVLSLLLMLTVSANAQPVANYDAATGNISFDGFDGVSSVRLFSAGGNLIPNIGETLGFGLTEKTATLYSWLDFGAGITGDALSAGNIVTPGTTLSDLAFDYKIGLAGPLTVGAIIPVVPEPTTLALAGLSMIGFVATRRRRS